MRGVTLLELVFVLVLTGLAVSLMAPAARRSADRFAVLGAREALAGRVATARSHALARGGAVLVLDEPTGTTWIESEGLVWDSSRVEGVLPVELRLPGARSRAGLRFDALGIGRVASQSVEFTRNRAAAALVISAYGGVRRR